MKETQEKRARRQFDRGFKVDAVRMVSEGGQRLSDVARQLGVTPKMLSQWRRQLEQHATWTCSSGQTRMLRVAAPVGATRNTRKGLCWPRQRP